MMIKRILIYMPLIALVMFFGCKKKVGDVNKDFIGLWYVEGKFKGEDFANSIEIKENSSAVYSEVGKLGNKTYTGKARIKGSVFKIGLKKFTVDLEPKQLGNVGNFWSMKLSGVTYYTNKDNSNGVGNYCSPTSLQVRNNGTSIIHAHMDGQPYTLNPGSSISSSINCFGCLSSYYDDKGNNFTFYNIACANTIQLQ